MKEKILIEYSGVVTYETIGELIHKFKCLVPVIGLHTGIYKRIILVMIESLENIMKYSENPREKEYNHKKYLPTFQISYNQNEFKLSSSNMIKKVSLSPLKDKLDMLNGLSQEKLKFLYKETITNGEFSENGGAGLGLIEMLKISGKPIKYEFEGVDNHYVIYSQYIQIDMGSHT